MDASEEFADLRRQIAELKSEILGLHKPVQIRKATEGAIRNHVSQVLCRLNSGDEIFPSDVAFEFGLDVEDVMCVMDKMREEGLLK
ncbi:MAG: hypothetical protein LBS92_05210 [Candidatus Methanoplasma sp.]|jgi:hypothetical protein|nr:hypothetical protein [Candidatus Methanoplasma sp.]